MIMSSKQQNCSKPLQKREPEDAKQEGTKNASWARTDIVWKCCSCNQKWQHLPSLVKTVSQTDAKGICETRTLYGSRKNETNRVAVVSLATLPSEILLHIFTYVPHDQSMISLRDTCRKFQWLLNDRAVWSNPVLAIHGHLKHRLLKRSIRTCSTLSTLDLKGCIQVSDQLVYHIVIRWPMVQHVFLEGCLLITNRALFALREVLGSLVSLSVSGCHLVSCYGLNEVLKKHHKTMRYLNISNCVGLLKDRFHISDIARYSHNFTELSAEWSTGYEKSLLLDSDLSHIASNCPNLRRLNIAGTPTHADSFQAIGSTCTKLEKLVAHRCYIQVSDLDILTKLKKLIHLDLKGCTNMREEVYKALYQNNTQLVYLNLSYCFSLTNHQCRLILSHLQVLKDLFLMQCYRINDRGIVNAGAHKELCFLDISGTLVSEDGLRELYRVKRKEQNFAFFVKAEGCPFIAARYSQPWKWH